jgi:hypothetical protein
MVDGPFFFSAGFLSQETDVVSGHLSRFAANFLIPKFSLIICHTVSLFIFNYSAISSTPNLQSEHTKVRALFAFALCPLRL